MLLSRILIIIIFILAGQEQSSVNVYRKDKPNRLEIYARNKNFYPVTLEVNFKLRNLESSRYLPYTEELKPGADEHILDLKIQDSRANWNYETTYKFYMGSYSAKHDDSYAYRFPFKKGETFRLTQGFDGGFSHGGDMRYSLDFDLPEGTPVYAARNGVVVDVEEQFKRGGTLRQFLDYANFITIMHDDGTFADYSHLKHKGASVKIGDKIKRGQRIGFSGATGYASGPHLHFVVKKTRKGGGFVSLPIQFTTKDGILVPEEGREYTGY